MILKKKLIKEKMYNENNIFAKIIKGEISCDKVLIPTYLVSNLFPKLFVKPGIESLPVGDLSIKLTGPGKPGQSSPPSSIEVFLSIKSSTVNGSIFENALFRFSKPTYVLLSIAATVLVPIF